MADQAEPMGADLESFFRAQWPRLVRSLTLVCGDDDAAQEAAQEALARVVVRWARVSAMRDPRAYCYRIAVNVLKRKTRQATRSANALQRVDAIVPTVAEQPDIATVLTIRSAMASLTPRQRQAVVLRYFADLDTDGAAQAMGCRAGTVRALLSQALQRLRDAGVGVDEHPEVSHG